MKRLINAASALALCVSPIALQPLSAQQQLLDYDTIHHPVIDDEAMVVSQNELASRIQALGADRSRLADELDGSLVKTRRLERTNREIAERLDAAEYRRPLYLHFLCCDQHVAGRSHAFISRLH